MAEVNMSVPVPMGSIFLTGFLYGTGFTTAAFVVIAIVRAVFHTGLC